MRGPMLFLILAAGLAAAEPPASATVRGVVQSAETHAPLAGARVACRGTAPVVTGADGRFTVALAPGEAVCEVSASGYLPATVRVVAGGAEEAEAPPLEIALASGHFR